MAASSRWAHPNIPFGLLAVFVAYLRGSLWMITDAYVLLLPDGFGTNQNVGIMEGIAGGVNLAAAAFMGVLTDSSFGRVNVLRLVAVLNLVMSAAIAVAVLYLPSHSSTLSVYITLCAAAGLFGLIRGGFMSAFEALFGDSTPAGARTRYYIYKQAVATLGMATGPLLAVICFVFTKNSWTIPECTVVVVVGAALAVLQAAVILFLKEVRTAPIANATAAASLLENDSAAEESAPGVSSINASNSIMNASSSSSINASTSIHVAAEASATRSTPAVAPTTATDAADTAAENAAADKGSDDQPRKKNWYVAPLIAASNIWSGMGSGIAYKFIPLFALSPPPNGLDLSPIAINGILAGMQCLATALGLGAQRLSRAIGPIGAAIAYNTLGITNLALICLSGSEALALPCWAVVTCILLRGAFMNGVGGLTGAVLNDHIAGKNRGKWSVVTQLGMCTWSGSAVLGGALVDRIGYRHTLFVTLGCHTISTCCLLPIVPVTRPDRQ